MRILQQKLQPKVTNKVLVERGEGRGERRERRIRILIRIRNNDAHFLKETVISLEITKTITNRYRDLYKEKTGKPHPNLSLAQWQKVVNKIESFITEWDIDVDSFIEMVDHHFKREIATDWNINHFATEGILQNLYYTKCYY